MPRQVRKKAAGGDIERPSVAEMQYQEKLLATYSPPRRQRKPKGGMLPNIDSVILKKSFVPFQSRHTFPARAGARRTSYLLVAKRQAACARGTVQPRFPLFVPTLMTARGVLAI